MVIDDFLAHSLSRSRARSREERRRIYIRDAISWTLVALIHLLFFMTLVISLQQNNERRGRRGPIETMLDLTLLNRNNAPPLTIIKPDVENDRDNDLSAKPLTVNTAWVKPINHTSRQSNRMRNTSASASPICRARLACGCGMRATTTDRKMTLSMPSTISNAVKVNNAAHASGLVRSAVMN